MNNVDAIKFKTPENFEGYYNYVYQKYDYDSFIASSQLSIDYIIIHYKPSIVPLNNAVSIPATLNKVSQNGPSLHRCCPVVNSITYNVEVSFNFSYDPSSGKYFSGTSFTLRHPDINLISYIESILGNNYTINSVEYTVDIFSPSPEELFHLVKLTSYLSWPGKAFDSEYDTTIYLNDGRGSSSKAGKSYVKDINGKVSVRIESIWKQRVLKKKNIRTMAQAVSLPAEDVFKFHKFQSFGNIKFFKHVVAKMKSVLSNEELKLWILEFEKSFFKRVYSKEDGGGVRVMRKIVKELGMNPAIYFHKHEFQDFFFKLIHGKKFI